MPKVSIYLSDDLYAEARRRDLPLSKLAQDAVERALAASDTDEWIARVRARSRRFEGDIDVADLLADVREDFGA